MRIKNTLATLFVCAVCLVLAPAQAGPNSESTDAAYAKGDPQLCLGCHGANSARPAIGILSTPHGQTGHPSGPMSKQGCQTCHGPASKHLSVYKDGKPTKPPVTYSGGATPVEVQNQSCLGCHENQSRSHWAGSTHQFAGVSCASCHTIHKPKDPVMEKHSQKEVCFSCHKSQRADVHKPSAHPILNDLMTCSDCHSPHGSSAEALLVKPSVNETCFQCHAEKRGPFIWEHAPVQENCSNCHQPHGSVHEPMLKARGPWLCQQCHVAAFHPSTAYSGSGIPPSGAAQQMLSKDCLNCHTKVHGSNHPSGVRLTR